MSIAIQQGGKPAHAVIYDPSKNELFTASRGRGAFLNDHRIRVSRCRRLEDALVGTGFPFREMTRLEPYMKQLGTMMASSTGVRRAGAAALDLAYVAAYGDGGYAFLDINAPQEIGSGNQGRPYFSQFGRINAVNSFGQRLKTRYN